MVWFINDIKFMHKQTQSNLNSWFGLYSSTDVMKDNDTLLVFRTKKFDFQSARKM